MQKLAKLVLLLVLPVALSGCAQTIVGIASCDIGNRVTVSKNDILSERTASEIEGNNRSRDAAGCKDANKHG